MSFYYIGNPDPEDPHRWAYDTSVNSTEAIIAALRKAGFHVAMVKNSESVSPYLDEIDVSRPGATREQVEQVCASARPDPKTTKPPPTWQNPRFFTD